MSIIKKPTTNISKVFAGLFMSVSLILFLVALHIMVLNETGDTKSVLLTTFEVSLKICISLATIFFVLILIYYIRVLSYIATTPRWYREEEMEENKDD